jgi:hypothetical protein
VQAGRTAPKQRASDKERKRQGLTGILDFLAVSLLHERPQKPCCTGDVFCSRSDHPSRILQSLMAGTEALNAVAQLLLGGVIGVTRKASWHRLTSLDEVTRSGEMR